MDADGEGEEGVFSVCGASSEKLERSGTQGAFAYGFKCGSSQHTEDN